MKKKAIQTGSKSFLVSRPVISSWCHAWADGVWQSGGQTRPINMPCLRVLPVFLVLADGGLGRGGGRRPAAGGRNSRRSTIGLPEVQYFLSDYHVGSQFLIFRK